MQTKTEKWTGMFLPGPAYLRTPSSTIYVMVLCTAPSGVGQPYMSFLLPRMSRAAPDPPIAPHLFLASDTM